MLPSLSIILFLIGPKWMDNISDYLRYIMGSFCFRMTNEKSNLKFKKKRSTLTNIDLVADQNSESKWKKFKKVKIKNKYSS